MESSYDRWKTTDPDDYIAVTGICKNCEARMAAEDLATQDDEPDYDEGGEDDPGIGWYVRGLCHHCLDERTLDEWREANQDVKD